ncbi:hypothetical protein [Zavarzinella formosa]|uniref:hypothetical protein n=1 Tax=Zavarzinella formosa TaxID=360055 RepID=UPI0002FD59CE|nr:hypothetical protein [Zavarzinella formosa]
MTIITFSQEQAEQIRSATDAVKFVDPTGVVLGHFDVKSQTTTKSKSPFSREEIEERRKQKGGKPLSEILARLREMQ